MKRRLLDIELSRDMCELVQKLHSSGFILGITSTNSPSLIRNVLDRASVSRFFYLMAPGGGIRDRASRLRRVVRHRSATGKHWTYVGDEIRDFESARACAVPFVGVDWGVTSAEAFAAAGSTDRRRLRRPRRGAEPDAFRSISTLLAHPDEPWRLTPRNGDMGNIPYLLGAPNGRLLDGKGDFRANTPSLEATMGTTRRAAYAALLLTPPTDRAHLVIASLPTMLKVRFTKRGSAALEATLRRMVVVFRFLGWIWMMLLVIVTLQVQDDPPLTLWIVYGSVALATAWTFLTWYMARSRPRFLSGGIWFFFDSLAMLAIGASSVAANADELFHGGLPLSYVFVGALWGGLPGSLIAAVFLAVEQFAVHVLADLGPVRAAGSIIFFVVATIVGWTFDRLRDYDIARQRAEGALAQQQAAVAVHEARLQLVDRLHDSVLQTFHAIRMGADDPAQSRYLARRQERELRRNIEEWRSEFDQSFRAALLAVRDEVEDVHRVEIEAVIRDDAALTPSLEAGVEAAREAMTNAAKHSRGDKIALFSELRDGQALIHVRDNGSGFDSERDEERVRGRLGRRVEGVGGLVSIESQREAGTDIKITVGA